MSTLSINALEQHLTLGNSDPLRDMYQELAEDFETCLLTQGDGHNVFSKIIVKIW
jgi:hypothetical protein